MQPMSLSLLEALPFPALLVGQHETIIAQNALAIELLNADGTGRHYFTQLRQPSVQIAIEDVLKGNGPQKGRFITRDETNEGAYLVSARPCDVDAGFACLVVFEDISDVEKAAQMRTGFVANVSHELRTPLTALLGFVETLQGPAKEDAAARDRFLGIMHKEASRMNRLIDDILSLSKLEAEERVRPSDHVNVLDILQSVLNANKITAREAEVTLNLNHAELDHTILGDADQITQVFTNLIGNAVKYGASGGVVDIDVDVQARNPFIRGRAVVVTVRDYGSGFDPIHIPRLTERFYRIDSHRSRDLGGTGLGLAIVKHILNRHRGRLRIESKEGQGASFMAIFPSAAPKDIT